MTDRKEIRRLLWRWGRVLDFCAERQREIAGFMELIDDAAEIKANQAGEKVGKGGISDPTPKAALRMGDIITRYREEVSRIMEVCDREMDFMRAMDNILDELPGDQRRVIELRYKQGFRWEYIAFKMCFSPQNVRRLDAEAVDKLAGMIQKEILR